MVSARRTILGAAVAAAALALVHAAAGAAAPVRWIVFSGEPEGTGYAELFRVQTDGTGIEQITKGVNPATDPDFSPDGKKVVFARLGSGIFRVNLDGSGLRRLTAGTRDSYPVWSPNGKRIVFLRVYKAQWRLFTVAAAGGPQKRLRLSPPAGRPTWSRDSKSLYIPAGGNLARINAATGKVEKYYDVTLDPTISQNATVSPDSKSVAFISKRVNNGPADCGESRCPTFALYLSGLAKGKPKRVANDTGPAGWSPDGKSLIFVYRRALTIAAIGSGARTTIPTGTHVAAGDAPPAWQPR